MAAQPFEGMEQDPVEDSPLRFIMAADTWHIGKKRVQKGNL